MSPLEHYVDLKESDEALTTGGNARYGFWWAKKNGSSTEPSDQLAGDLCVNAFVNETSHNHSRRA
jgi:hypothetical protein